MISFVLMVGDALIIMLSFYLAAKIRMLVIPYLGGSVYWPVYQPVVKLAVGFTVGIFYFNDLYPGFGKTAVKEIQKISCLVTLTYLFLGGMIYFVNAYEDFPRSIFILAWGISIILIPLLRVLIRNRISHFEWYGVSVIFASDQLPLLPALKAVQNCRRMGWNPVALYALNGIQQDEGNVPLPVISSWDALIEIKRAYDVELAVFAARNQTDNAEILRKFSSNFEKVTLVVPYYNIGSLWVKPRDLEGNLGLEITYHLLNNRSKTFKRMVDLVGSVFLLLLLSPLLLLLSLLIALDSPGPVFFRQQRLGKNLECFPALKFRSMVHNAEAVLQELLDSDPQARYEYSKYHKLEDDPRITRVGRFMRKFSLDEMPQLWNVLKGEMSLIGPRAYMPSELEEIGDYAEIILRIRPGMTGWWQVMGRHNTTFEERLLLDEYYISNWSLWMDLYILYKTFWVVISGTGT